MTPDEASVSGVPQKTKTATALQRLPVGERTSPRQFLPACAETGDSSDFVFGRDKEIAELRERLCARESFVLHGSSGTGKTFLLQRVMQALPGTLYCSDAASPQVVFQSLALLSWRPEIDLSEVVSAIHGWSIPSQQFRCAGLCLTRCDAGPTSWCSTICAARRRRSPRTPATSCSTEAPQW